MSIVLEPIEVGEPEVVEAPEVQEEEQEPVAEVPVAEVPVAPETEIQPVPAPKKRGRPPKAKSEAKAPPVKAPPKAKPVKRPKPAPPPESSESSDVDETLKNVYNHVSKPSKPDMETAILQFLVNRKQTEAQRRRTLWSQLAQM